MRGQSPSLTKLARRAAPAVLGLALGALGSLALIAQRLSGGDTHAAIVLLGALVGVSACVTVATRATVDAHAASAFAAQVAGAALAIAISHAGLVLAIASGDGALRLVRETPSQLVNDVVLLGSLLLVSWSFVARRTSLRVAFGVLPFVLVALYARTASWWHADLLAFPVLTTQRFVCAQVVGVSAGMLGLHWIPTPRAS